MKSAKDINDVQLSELRKTDGVKEPLQRIFDNYEHARGVAGELGTIKKISDTLGSDEQKLRIAEAKTLADTKDSNHPAVKVLHAKFDAIKSLNDKANKVLSSVDADRISATINDPANSTNADINFDKADLAELERLQVAIGKGFSQEELDAARKASDLPKEKHGALDWTRKLGFHLNSSSEYRKCFTLRP